jgi:hypothetical protein
VLKVVSSSNADELGPSTLPYPVTPAKAGVQSHQPINHPFSWMPAYAGMTGVELRR